MSLRPLVKDVPSKFPFNERDLFLLFLSAADLEACVQLHPSLKKKKKHSGTKTHPFFFRGGAPSICYTLK